MARKIHCKCGKYVGEIRDAKLARGLTFLCRECSKPKREKADNQNFFDLFESFKNLKG